MTEFPNALKHWRKQRRFSQLDLALAADVSARHISFLETGRSRPSPDMISRLCEALSLPPGSQNQLLSYAGFAPRFRERDWNEEAMTPVRQAVEHTLQSHSPYPALALDRHWTVLHANPSATMLFGLMGLGVGSSLLQGMRDLAFKPFIENWPEVAHAVAQRLRTESSALGGDPALDEAAEVLAAEPAPSSPAAGPFIPTVYRSGDLRLQLFSTIAQFGSPEDLMLADLKLEMFFPADEPTRLMLEGLAKTGEN